MSFSLFVRYFHSKELDATMVKNGHSIDGGLRTPISQFNRKRLSRNYTRPNSFFQSLEVRVWLWIVPFNSPCPMKHHHSLRDFASRMTNNIIYFWEIMKKLARQVWTCQATQYHRSSFLGNWTHTTRLKPDVENILHRSGNFYRTYKFFTSHQLDPFNTTSQSRRNKNCSNCPLERLIQDNFRISFRTKHQSPYYFFQTKISKVTKLQSCFFPIKEHWKKNGRPKSRENRPIDKSRNGPWIWYQPTSGTSLSYRSRNLNAEIPLVPQLTLLSVSCFQGE